MAKQHATQTGPRIDEVGRTGIYPASGPWPPGPAEVREQGELAHPEERRRHRLLLSSPLPTAQQEMALHLVGRTVLGGYFLYNGLNHFQNRERLTGYARSKHVPLAPVAVPLTGAMLIAGGLSLLLGRRPKIGAALVAGFLGAVSPVMHAYWKAENEQERGAELSNFAKNLALIGAAALVASTPEPWPASVDRAIDRFTRVD
jgi:putative oxidoreductase